MNKKMTNAEALTLLAEKTVANTQALKQLTELISTPFAVFTTTLTANGVSPEDQPKIDADEYVEDKSIAKVEITFDEKYNGCIAILRFRTTNIEGYADSLNGMVINGKLSIKLSSMLLGREVDIFLIKSESVESNSYYSIRKGSLRKIERYPELVATFNESGALNPLKLTGYNSVAEKIEQEIKPENIVRMVEVYSNSSRKTLEDANLKARMGYHPSEKVKSIEILIIASEMVQIATSIKNPYYVAG